MRSVFHAALILPFLVATGCLGPIKSLYPPAPGENSETVYVVSHGWHTGLVIGRENISEKLWPAANDFAPAKFIEAGWGDDGFYRAPKITVFLTLRALFWPYNPSVLHLVAVNDPVTDFAGSKLIAVKLSPKGFERMCAFIGRTHEYTEDHRPIWLGPGIYGESSFYRARGNYHFPKTCNHWTACALREAGCPITPFYSVTAGNVLYQTRKFGRSMAMQK